MPGLGSGDVLLFEGFRFDARGCCLFRVDQFGAAEPVALGSRGLELLGLLLRRSGELVSKDEIMEVVWPGRAVEEANLNVQISKLRHILDQKRLNGSCIQTITGHGYRFTAEVTRTDLPAAAPTLPGCADAPRMRARAEEQIAGEPYLPKILRSRRFWSGITTMVMGALALVTLLTATLGWHSPRSSEARFKPPPLSIVVLPFANLSNDREQQYFADGVTEDLTTDLSRVGQMFVISHNTAATYRDKPVDTKQLGRELGIRYVLEGEVQRSGDHLRVNARLSDAETAVSLWAQRFDRSTDDLFALQNEITRRIAVALKLEMIDAAAASSNEHPDAFDYILRGREVLKKPATRETRAQAVSLFERALGSEPHSATAQSWLARTLAVRESDQMAEAAATDVARANGLVEHALAISPGSALAHYARATVLRAENRFEEAIPEYELAVDFDRNWLDAYANLGQCKFYVGLLEEYIPLVEQAIRLSPRDPMIGVWFGRIGLAHLLQSHFDEAIHWLEKARNASPASPYVHARLAAAYALKGETQRAGSELAGARSLSGDDHYSSITRLRAEYLGVPKIRALYESVYFAGLHMAGLSTE